MELVEELAEALVKNYNPQIKWATCSKDTRQLGLSQALAALAVFEKFVRFKAGIWRLDAASNEFAPSKQRAAWGAAAFEVLADELAAMRKS